MELEKWRAKFERETDELVARFSFSQAGESPRNSAFNRGFWQFANGKGKQGGQVL